MTSKPTRHTDQQFAAELQDVKDRLLAMGGRCEELIRDAIRAVEEGDSDLARRVEARDAKVNADEVAVDELAVRILALRHPVGRDLRLVVTALKAVVDMERIGDEAVNIAERVPLPDLDALRICLSGRVPEMGSLAVSMLSSALDAFVQEDARAAHRVLVLDDEVDRLHTELLAVAVAFIRENPERARAGMALASCAKYIERIADHCTNIAEMVIYMVDGVDVRHRRHLE